MCFYFSSVVAAFKHALKESCPYWPGFVTGVAAATHYYCHYYDRYQHIVQVSKQYFGLQKAKWVHAIYCCYMLEYGVHHTIILLLADVQLRPYGIAAFMLPAQKLWAVLLGHAQGLPTDPAQWVLESNDKGLIKGVTTGRLW